MNGSRWLGSSVFSARLTISFSSRYQNVRQDACRGDDAGESSGNSSDAGYDASTVFYGSSLSGSATSPASWEPRMVCVDAKGSVRRELRDVGPSATVLDVSHDENGALGVELWDGGVQDVTGRAETRRVSLGSSAVVRKEYWGDFMNVRSEKSRIHVVSAVQRWGREERAWSVHGERCPLHGDELESIEESVRVLAEKADTLAGFIVMADDRSVWGNVASSVLEEMRDDYRGKATFLFATRCKSEESDEDVEREKAVTARSFMEGLAVSSLAPLVDLYVPIYGRGRTVDELFQWTMVNAIGIFGATLPLMWRGNSTSMDMAHIASCLGAGHHRCPLATLDVFSPALASPLALSGHARAGDAGRITECVSILCQNEDDAQTIGSNGHSLWFDMEAVSLSRPSTRVVSRIGAGVPIVRGVGEVPAFQTPFGTSSISCATVLGSTTAFAPELRSLAGKFCPSQVRGHAALLESWGVQGLYEEVHEDLLSMADCFD